MKLITLLLAIAALSISTNASAHPGGLDEKGGHFDKKTGKYHVHGLPPSKGDPKALTKAPAKKKK